MIDIHIGSSTLMNNSILHVALGWALGILSTILIERLNHFFFVRGLKTAIEKEIHELQFVVVLGAFALNDYSNEITDDFLEWFEKIIFNYKGTEPTEHFKKLVTLLKSIPKETRSVLSGQNENEALSIIPQITPLLDAHINEVIKMPLSEQAKLMRLRRKLHIYNQTVESVQKKKNETFNPALTSENYARIVFDMQREYKLLARLSINIGDLCAP